MKRKQFVEEFKEVSHCITEIVEDNYSDDKNFIWHEYWILPVKYIRKAPKELGPTCLLFQIEIESIRSFTVEVHSKPLTDLYPLNKPEKNYLTNTDSISYKFAMSWNRTVYETLLKRKSKLYKKEIEILDRFFDFYLINIDEYDSLINLDSSKKRTRDSLWAIADDMRARKDAGEFETYREAYKWAEDNIIKTDVIITAGKLENAYHKAVSEGKL